MGFKKNIIRIVFLVLWIVLGSSVLVLLAAAINIKNHKSCKGIDIEIAGVKEIFFLGKADILHLIADEGITRPAGMYITSFNLEKLEAVIEKNIWVRDAELFFDNNLVLHINILEREPVARIFAANGSSFYIDSSGSKMPLHNKMNVKLPVFTGFPGDGRHLLKSDSTLLHHIKDITKYLLNNRFWLAQVSQVDITADGNFEMVPTIGTHIIEFGNGENYETKFKRLMIFYEQVLSQTGINTYSKISVRYRGQVIGTRKGLVTKIDSIQALLNISKMIEDAKKISEDSVYAPTDKIMGRAFVPDSMIMDLRIDSGNEVQKNALKSSTISLKYGAVKNKPATVIKPIKKAIPKQDDSKPTPKAVMGKLNN